MTSQPLKNPYPKLVRDRIPEIITATGELAETHVADYPEYLRYLLAKLVEEATELQAAPDEAHQKEELADVREVLSALQAALQFDETELQAIQTAKAEARGGFEARIILDSVSKA